VSSLGNGTYLGRDDDWTDAAYTVAVRRALQLGINVVDTAINYRNQRSERAVGRALRGRDLPRAGGRLHQGRVPPLRRGSPSRSALVRGGNLSPARPARLGRGGGRRALPVAAIPLRSDRSELPQSRRGLHRCVLPAQPRGAA